MSAESITQNRSDADSRCCCNRHSDEAHVIEAGLQSFPASDPPDWSLGRESENCARTSPALANDHLHADEQSEPFTRLAGDYLGVALKADPPDPG